MRALLLDRDGTITVERGHLADPALLEFYPGAVDALGRAQRAGWRLVLVTNQAGVARGLFSLADVDRFHEAMCDRLAHAGVELAGVYVCPHHPDGEVAEYSWVCRCRKPAPGLLEAAIDDLALDAAACVTVGDRHRDVVAGLEAGTRAIGLRTGFGRKEFAPDSQLPGPEIPEAIHDDLAAAIDHLLAEADPYDANESGSPDGNGDAEVTRA